MKFEDIIQFAEAQVECLEELLIPAATRVEFTSGGPMEDVWCDTKEKATELWCYEFSRYVKEHPGKLMWGQVPQMDSRKFHWRSKTAYMENQQMYCVYSTFAIKKNAEA